MLKSWHALFFVVVLLSSILIVSSSLSAQAKILSPRQQIANGILPENVICPDNLVLIKKYTYNSVACVKPQTAKKLVEGQNSPKFLDWGAHIDITGTLDFTDVPTGGHFASCIQFFLIPSTNETNNLSIVKSEKFDLYQNVIVHGDDSVTIEPPGDKLVPNLKGEKIHVVGFLFEHPDLGCGSMSYPQIVPSVIDITH